MIETIRLIHNKEGDIESIFLFEFFSLIGCMVYDYTVPCQEDLSFEMTKGYDLNLIIGISEEEIKTEKKYRYLKLLMEEELDKDAMSYVPLFWKEEKECSAFDRAKSILKILVPKLYRNDCDSKYFDKLIQYYVDYDMFFYLHHVELLPLMREYYPVYGRKTDTWEVQDAGVQSAFKYLSEGYIELRDSFPVISETPFYYQYALLNLKYQMNKLDGITGNSRIFRTANMLEWLEELKKEYSFIKIDYLAGRMCSADIGHYWETKGYFNRAVNEFQKKYSEIEIGDFLFHGFGNDYENKKKDLKEARKWYELAYKVNPFSYKALYKVAKKHMANGNYNQAVNEFNQIIHMLLNGYKALQLTPKQQLYIYKAYVGLGDIFYDEERYNLASRAYERAIYISDTISQFYNMVRLCNDDMREIYRKVLKACMPTQPIYFTLIKCASNYNDMERVDNYYERLKKP